MCLGAGKPAEKEAGLLASRQMRARWSSSRQRVKQTHMLVRQDEATTQQDKGTEHMVLQSQQAWTSMPAFHMQQTGRNKAMLLIYEVDKGSSPCHAHRCFHL